MRLLLVCVLFAFSHPPSAMGPGMLAVLGVSLAPVCVIKIGVSQPLSTSRVPGQGTLSRVHAKLLEVRIASRPRPESRGMKPPI